MLRKTSVALGATFALVGSMLALPNAALAAPNDPVNIPDATLRDSITETLSGTGHIVEGELKESDLAALTFLNLEGKNVTDLTGLEFATGMRALNLTGTTLTDISALTGLPALSSLEANNSAVSEGSFRAVAPTLNLEAVEVAGTGLAKAAFDVTNPYYINAANTGIESLAGLEDNDRLSGLNISNNPVSDASALRGHTLDNLVATGTLLYDLTNVSVASGDITVTDNREVGYNEPFSFGVFAPTAGSTPVDFDVTGDYDYSNGELTLRTEGLQKVTWNWSVGDTRFSGESSFLVGFSGLQPLTLSASPRQDSAVISWTRPEGVSIASYDVQVLDSNRQVVSNTTVPATATSATVASPSNARPFYVTVNYTTASGGTSPLAEVEARSFATAPVAPQVSVTYSPEGPAALVSVVNASAFDIPTFRVVTTTDNGASEVTSYTANGVEPFRVPLSEVGGDQAVQYVLNISNGDASSSFGDAAPPVVVDRWGDYTGPRTADSAIPLNVRFQHTEAGLLALWDVSPTDDRYRVVVNNGSSVETLYPVENRQVIPAVAGSVVVVSARSVGGDWVSAAPIEYTPASLTKVQNLEGSSAEFMTNLTWDHVDGANAYDVTGVDDLGETRTWPTTTNSFEVASNIFSDASNVRWSVRARESLLEVSPVGPYSDILVVGDDGQTGAPSSVQLAPVTNLRGEYDADTNTVRFTWTPDEDAERFDVNINGTSFRVSEPVYVLRSPEAGSTVNIAVAQRGFAQTFNAPVAAEFVVPDDAGPVEPGEGSLSTSVEGDDVRLTWTPRPDVERYVLRVNNLSTFENTTVNIPSNIDWYTVEGGADDTIIFTLELEGEGESLLDTYRGVYQPGEGIVPVTDAPAAATITNVVGGPDGITVTWTVPEATDVVYVSAVNADGSVQRRVFVANDVRSYTFAGLPIGEFTFTVGVRDDASPYAFSNAVPYSIVGGGGDDGSGETPGGGNGENPGGGTGTPGGGTGEPGRGDDDSANGGAGGAAGNGATPGGSDNANAETDVIKQTGASDLPTFIGYGFLLMAGLLLGGALIRRKKPVTVKS